MRVKAHKIRERKDIYVTNKRTSGRDSKGNRDTTEAETEEIIEKLEEAVYNDYDLLILLCDAISGAGFVMDMIDRMNDVKSRYGSYAQDKWEHNIYLKSYFEEKMGRDLYEAVEQKTFHI
ncbi:MAG: phosphohydrolase [Lachnospiraceae bacterium]|nr:phosphohydrolase [Lachnospiraceae bacterium]